MERNMRRKLQYDICTSIDIIKLSIALKEAVKNGMPEETAELFKLAAKNLLDLIIIEKDKCFPIYSDKNAYSIQVLEEVLEKMVAKDIKSYNNVAVKADLISIIREAIEKEKK